MKRVHRIEKLIGSAASLENLRDLIKKNWYWSDITFVKQTEKLYKIQLKNGTIPDELQIIKKGDRFRLELMTGG